MKKAMQVALLSAAGVVGALAAPTVQIRLHDSDGVGKLPLATAKFVTGKMLASAGLGVSLAESFPFAREGNRVTVFFDRVEEYAQHKPPSSRESWDTCWRMRSGTCCWERIRTPGQD